MERAITAVYPSHAEAARVRSALTQLGIPGGHITLIPDAETAGGSENTGAMSARLHDLGLPDEDTRTYDQAIRNGDAVLSVKVDDVTRLDRIKSVMRDPGSARDLDALDEEYRGAEYVPFRHEDRPAEPQDRAIREDPLPGERADLRGYTRAKGPRV